MNNDCTFFTPIYIENSDFSCENCHLYPCELSMFIDDDSMKGDD